jgi:hypothetical protein
MLIKVCCGAFTGDAPEPTGDEIWVGGYSGEDDDKLPAALLAALVPEFEVGRWYAIAEFTCFVDQAQDKAHELPPTTIDIPQMDVGGKWTATSEIGQGMAVVMLCEAVLTHARNLAKGRPLWIRVE